MGDGGERHSPATLSSGKGTGTNCTGGEVGARTGLDACKEEKIACPQPRLEPGTFHPLPSLHTDYPIPAAMTGLLPAYKFM